MHTPPTFASREALDASLDDVDFWAPYVDEILARHGLAEAGRELVAGYNVTYPTFVSGDVVVKLFGHYPSWRERHAAERGAYELIGTDSAIAAPTLLGEGRLYDLDAEAHWPYLVTTRVPGVASWRAALSPDQRRAIAVELGQQVRRIHELPPFGVATDADQPELDVAAAAAQSSLPPHLVAQVDAYVTGLGPFDPVFIHGDIVANHVFVDSDHLTGIIDWGDAMVTDRHVELIQVYRDMFDCDKDLFRVFLDAADWPVDADFPRLALGHALRRQALMRAQHDGGDVFEPIAAAFPLQDIATLDDLATELFAL
jgi:aminoglycoside phosphotransferase